MPVVVVLEAHPLVAGHQPLQPFEEGPRDRVARVVTSRVPDQLHEEIGVAFAEMTSTHGAP
jgi:hypothetical protein